MAIRARFLSWLASKLPTRTIYGGTGRDKYLSRSYILGRPRMPDGSDPFDGFGDSRPDAVWPSGIGVYLHRFHRSDEDRELHNHPWQWGLSLILDGGYVEERRRGRLVEKRERVPGDVNWISHDDFHRVDLLGRECWSLFVAGPKVSSWGFWNRVTDEFLHWRAFLDQKRKAA